PVWKETEQVAFGLIRRTGLDSASRQAESEEENRSFANRPHTDSGDLSFVVRSANSTQRSRSRAACVHRVLSNRLYPRQCSLRNWLVPERTILVGSHRRCIPQVPACGIVWTSRRVHRGILGLRHLGFWNWNPRPERRLLCVARKHGALTVRRIMEHIC